MILFTILFFIVLSQCFAWVIKISWTFWKVALGLLFFPLIVIGFVASGLIYIAEIGLVILGIVSLVNLIKLA